MKPRTKPGNGAQLSTVGLSDRDNHATLVVYASKGKTLLWSLGLLFLAVAMVVVPGVVGPQIRVSAGFYENPTTVILMQVGGALFGAMALRAVTILFSATPRVVVSHEGIWVNSLLFGSAIIPWAEMRGLLVMGRRWPPLGMLHIVLRDRQTLRDRQNRGQRLAWWLGGYSLIWPQSIPAPDIFLPMSTEELVARIRVRFQPELVQHGIRILDIGERRPPMPRMPRRR